MKNDKSKKNLYQYISYPGLEFKYKKSDNPPPSHIPILTALK